MRIRNIFYMRHNSIKPVILKYIIAFTFLFVLFQFNIEYSYSETHPIWNPTGNVSELQSNVASYAGMSDSELRSQLNTAGKSDPHNIDMVFVTYDFALLYHLTGDINHAHKAAVLLDRYAEVFPEWPLDYSRSIGHYMWYDSWYHRDLGLVARFLAQAYDLLYSSGAFEAINSGTKDKVKNFLIQVVQVDSGYYLYMFNAAGTRPLGIFIFGRVLEDPELVHVGFWYYNKMIHEYFCNDGFIDEGNYEYMASITRSLTMPEYKFYFDGYSDPPDYQHVPFDSRWDPVRIDNLDMEAIFKPMWDRMSFALWETTFPDLIWPVMNETFAFPIGYSGTKYHAYKSPLQESLLMGGIGHAALAYGSGSNQTQVRLDFSHAVGHQHNDALHLIYYCKGEEVIGGTGYPYMNRSWNTSTLNQNLVVVNGHEQKYDYWTDWTKTPYIPGQGRLDGQPTSVRLPDTNTHNNIILFEPGYKDFKKVQVTEVDALNAYDNVGATRYQRMLALVNIADDDVYLVDFFRVKGGTQYDWTIHGGHETFYKPYHPAYSSSTNLSMSSTSGSFGLINFQQRATTNNSWYGEYNYNGVINRFTMCGRSNTTVYKGTAPQSIKNSTHDQDYFVARRSASSSQDENYLVVHETYTGSPKIQSIEELQFDGDPGSAAGVKVTLLNGVVDYIVHTLDDGPSYPVHQISGINNFILKGRFAHIRVTNDQVTWMKLIQGVSLSFGNRTMSSIKGDFSYRGYVTHVNRIEENDSENSFVVDTSLPSNGELNGKTLIITLGNGWNWGYKIKSVVGNRIITDNEPGFNLDGNTVDWRYFPNGQYPGPVSFIIPGTAIMDENGSITSIEGDQLAEDEIPPTILNATPANNSQNVDCDGTISLTFNETMDTGSVESAFSISPTVNVQFNWTGNSVTITPTQSLTPTQNYSITVAATAIDISGNPLDGNKDGVGGDDFSLSFTTETPPELIYLYVEAETGTLTTPMQTATDPDASGNSYVYIPEGTGNSGDGAVDISINVPYNDSYVVWGRVTAPSKSDDSYYVFMDGDKDRIWDCLYELETLPNVWTWDQLTERGTGTFDNPQYDPAVFTLNAGNHTIKFKNREDGVKLDRILITNDFNFEPAEAFHSISYALPVGYVTIAVPVRNNDITKASELAAAIEAQIGENAVNGLSYWDTATQRFISFAPHLPPFLQGTNFDITCGLPVLANTTISGTWTLTGFLEELCYNLNVGYNTIALSLDKNTITSASELAAAIEASIGENSVNGLSYWDSATQRWISFAPHLPPFLQGTNFPTQIGQYYLVNMVLAGNF